MLKPFLNKHGDTADSLAKSGGSAMTIYALLSGPWTFVTLAGATAAFGVAVGALKKLQEIADGNFEGESYREKNRLRLALAAREAYLSAATTEIPRTLKAYEKREIPTFGTVGQLEDLGPEETHARTLAARAAPVFDFLEAKLLMLLTRAQVPDSERKKCCDRIRTEAAAELTSIIGSDQKRFGNLFQTHILDAAEIIHSGTASGGAGGKASGTAVETTTLPLLESEGPGFVRQVETAVPPSIPALANASAPAPTLTGTLKALYEDRFLKARLELEQGSSADSAKLFGELAAELRHLAQAELLPLLVRCLHNQGVSLYNCNRRLEAAVCFEEGLSHPQQNSRTKLGRFFAPYCREKFDRALEEVRAVIREHPEETSYRVHEAECLWRLDRQDEALSVLEAHPVDIESHYTLLSQLRASRGDFAKAKEAAEAGLKIAPASGQLRMAALFADAKPIFDRLYSERRTRRFISVADKQILEAACANYLWIADDARRDGLQIIEADAAAMVGNIRLACGDPRGALPYFGRALVLTPSSQTILGNKYLALVRLGETAAARKFAEESKEIWGLAESIGRQAAAWLEEGRADVVIELLEKAFGEAPELKDDATLQVIRLQASGIARKPEVKAEALAFAAESGRSARDLISAAEILASIGERAEAEKLILRAEKAADGVGEDGLLVRTVAGLLFFRYGEWSEAVRRLGVNGMDPVESEHVAEIIVCLINLNDVTGAVNLAERMITLDRGTPAIERALAHCYLRIGREGAAEPLLRNIVAREGRFRDRLSLFQVTQRLRPLRSALPILEQAVESFPDQMEGHLILSGAYHALRQHSLSLVHARKAQLLAPDDPQVIRHFARFIPNTFPAKLLNDDDRAMMRRAMGDREVFTPIELPEKDGQPDITPILTQLRKRREHVTLVMEHYRKQRLPLCFIAGILGETTFSMWWVFSRGTSERLFLTRGNAETQQEETAACEKKAAVLDATALFTLAELGLLDLPGKCFERIYVDTDTLVNLKVELTALGLQAETQQVAHYHEGKLVIQDSDASDYRARVARLTEIVAFLHDNPQVKVHGPSAGVWAEFQGNEQAKQAAESMPKGAFVPALVAKTEDAAYYSDDEGLRGIVTKEFKLAGFSTQALLRRAGTLGLLDLKAYDAAVTTLLRCNCHFVSVDRGYILRHLQQEKFVRDRVADRLLEEIGTTKFGPQEGSFELGLVAGFIWFNTLTVGQPNRSHWLKTVAQAVGNLPSTNSAMLYFGLGLLVELLRFPTLFIGLTDALIHDAGLAPKASRSLQLVRHQLINHLRTVSFAGDESISTLWTQAYSNATQWRKLARSPRRL